MTEMVVISSYVRNDGGMAMPRPQKCRRICAMPGCMAFAPCEAEGVKAQDVVMTLDEYESIRLIDLLDLTQEEAARQMCVARTTVQAVYDGARRKLAEALVGGKMLVIQGGSYELCPHAQECCGRDCTGAGCLRGQCRFCEKRHCGQMIKQEAYVNENRGDL